jgi:hypothetical protein
MPVDHQGLPGMQAHTDPDGSRCERLTDRVSAGDRVPRRAECAEERVALRVDLDTTVLGKCRTDDVAVPTELDGVPLRTELREQPRRSLDVGEEERDGAGWKLRGHELERTTCVPAARRAGMRR